MNFETLTENFCLRSPLGIRTLSLLGSVWHGLKNGAWRAVSRGRFSSFLKMEPKTRDSFYGLPRRTSSKLPYSRKNRTLANSKLPIYWRGSIIGYFERIRTSG